LALSVLLFFHLFHYLPLLQLIVPFVLIVPFALMVPFALIVPVAEGKKEERRKQGFSERTVYDVIYSISVSFLECSGAFLAVPSVQT